MADFLKNQMDYIFFFYGLAFVLLGAICFILNRMKVSRLPWMWLGMFGFVHGLNEWLNILSLSLGDSPVFMSIRTCTMVLSFVFLLEFGRIGTFNLTGKGPSRIVLYVLSAFAVVGGLAGWSGFSATSRYTLGFVGGTWSAYALILASRNEDRGCRLRLLMAGMAIGAYAVVTGLIVPKASFFPASLINQATFFEVFGVPIQLVRGVFAVWTALSVWTYRQTLNYAEDISSGISYKSRIRALIPLVLLPILICGWVLTVLIGNRGDAMFRSNMLSRAKIAAAAIVPARVDALTGSSNDVGTPNLDYIRHQLRSIRASSEDCRFVYLMGQRNGKLVFLADAEAVGSEDYSAPGEAYEDATPELVSAMSTGKAFVEGPVEDEWGNWVSGVAGIRDPITDHIVCLVGIDVDASKWMHVVGGYRLFCIIITFLLCVWTVTFFLVLQNKEESRTRTAASERRYRSLVEGAPNWVTLFDQNGCCVTTNQAGLSTMGWAEADIIGKKFSDLWPKHNRMIVDNAIGRALRGTQSSFEAECIRSDGQSIIWDVVINPIVDDNGKVNNLVGIAADTTERKKAAEALQESQRILTTLMSNLPGMAYRCNNDREWTFEFVSEGCYDLTGYRARSLIGNKDVTFAQLIHPDDQNRIWSEVQTALAARKPFPLTYRLTTAYGEEKWVWEQGRGVYDSDGNVIALEGFIADITNEKRAEKALVEERDRAQKYFDFAAVIMLVIAADQTVTMINKRGCEVLEYEEEQIVGKNWFDITTPEHLKNEYRAFFSLLTSGEIESTKYVESVVLTKSGKERTIAWRNTVIRDEKGNIVATLSSGEDFTHQKKVEADLRIQASAINAATDQIVITSPEGKIEFVNPAFERETGYSFDEVVGENPRVLKSGKHDDEFYKDLWDTILSGKTWRGEVVNCHKDGSMSTDDMTITPVLNEKKVISHFVAIKRDISEKKHYEEKLDRMAHHDPLTGLPNRLLFSDRLTQRLSHRHGQSLAVMFLDLDRFKLINDTLGHNVGDTLLKKVAAILTSTLRDVDTIARMGGDEFTIMLAKINSEQDAATVAKKVLSALSKPLILDGHELFVSASIGISLYPADGEDVETLVKNADTAMYRAKEQGRNNYQFYTESLNSAALERMTLESSLRRALEREEFLVYYQPRVSINSGKILGMEALVRWQHPDFGLIPPVRFISLAEETGLIAPMSEWVMRTACAQNKAWQDAGFLPIDIAVNISTRQFQQEDLIETVKAVLAETGLEPKYLDLEITESTLMQNPESVAQTLYKLKAMGVRTSIDDFGTGYSSLSYLKRFPIDTVKIDQSFVRDITNNPDDAAIAGAVVGLAHSLKLRVIAEGVETIEQLKLLQLLKCDEMQGYFISRPLPFDEITHLLQEERDSESNIILRAA